MSRPGWPIVGVDPGGRETGIVVRDRDTVTYRRVLTRSPGEPVSAYCWRVAVVVRSVASEYGAVLVAAEDVNEPEPHMGITSVRGLLDTAQVLGAVEALSDDVVVVPPARHGAGLPAAYPAVLVGERERKGAGVLRHARSAFDIAGAGHQLALIHAATGGR